MPTRAPGRRLLSGDQLSRLRILIDKNTEAQVTYAVTAKGEMQAQLAKSILDRFLKSLRKRVPDHMPQEE